MTKTAPKQPSKNTGSSSNRTPVNLDTQKSKTPLLVGAAIVLVAFLALVAAIVSRGGDSSNDETLRVDEVADVTVTGTPLAAFPESGNDPAVGTAIPTLVGTSFNGDPVEVSPGKPTLLMFLAHWCPHCQREVPVVTEWIKARGGIGDTRLVAVSTSVDSKLPNFPPSTWLQESGLPAELLRDDENKSAANAYNLPGFPYFLAITADGKVAKRASGELSIPQLEEMLSAATGASAAS